MNNLLRALICLKQALICPKSQEKSVAYQIIQSVHPIHLPDTIFNKIIKRFVEPAHDYNGDKCYSRAITGEPICALVMTDKEPWIVAVTRSIKVEWPEYDISFETVFKRLRKIRDIHKVNGAFSADRIDLTDINKSAHYQAQHRSLSEPKILRDTEGRDFLVFPLIGKMLSFKNGFRIQMNKKGHGGIRPLDLEATMSYRKRVQDVFELSTLRKLWEVYQVIEKDPKLYEKYIKGEIVGEPIDRRHPLAKFHATLWKDDYSGFCGMGGIVPGILPVNTDGMEYKRETRHSIPIPENGVRLVYKNEIPLLSSSKRLIANEKK